MFHSKNGSTRVDGNALLTLSVDEIDDLVLFINGDLDLAKTIAERENKPNLLTVSFLRKALNNKKQGKTIIICSSFIVSPCLLSFPVYCHLV